MSVSAEIVGRDEQLAELRRFLTGGGDGPAALLLEGEAGIGKTTLWEAALGDVGERFAHVASARPAEAERGLSFTALGDLLRDHFDSVRSDLPAPQRQALEVALLLEPGGERVPEARAVAAGFLGALRLMARDGRVLVAVDDVQWLDPPSATALAYALRRLPGEPVSFLLAQRVEADRPTALGLDRPVAGLAVRRLRVGPLSLAALQRLLRNRLGTTFPRPLMRRIRETAAGNPFFALELARALGRLDAPVPGAPLPVPDELGALLRERIDGLPRETAHALLAAALLGEPSPARLEAAIGTGAAAALRPAIEANVVRVEHGRLRFEHPLLASVCVESAEPVARRKLHRRFADLIDEPEEQARHLALAADGADEAVAAALDRASIAVARRGARDAAAGLAEQAWQLTPPELVEKRVERTVEAGWYAWMAGDGHRASELLDAAITELEPGPLRAWALNRLTRVELWLGNRRAAVELADTALRDAGGDPVLRAELHEIRAWCLLVAREDLRQAARTAALAVRMAEQLNDPVQLSDALAVHAQSEFLLGGGLPSASMERALGLHWNDLSERAMRRPELHWSLMLQCADRFEEARANLELVREHALECGDESALPWILMRLSHVELHAGDWDAALRLAEDALAEALQTLQEAQAGVVLCTRALVLAHLGRAGEARAAADEGLARAERHADGIGLRIGRFALGHLALSLGDTDECVLVLDALWSDNRAAGNVEPGENRFLGDLCEALVAAGRLDRAAEVVTELELRGTELDRPGVLAVAARCRGLLAAAGGDRETATSELHAALQHHDRVLLPFQRARTLLALGSVQRAARHRRDARRCLEEARAGFAALGAELWQGRAEDELGRVGGRAPTADGLTGAEQRVAALVATGRTNREVAAELVLAERTVESHLSHIYRKLGVRSRAELAHRFKVP